MIRFDCRTALVNESVTHNHAGKCELHLQVTDKFFNMPNARVPKRNWSDLVDVELNARVRELLGNFGLLMGDSLSESVRNITQASRV
jgi:hypothetical protein